MKIRFSNHLANVVIDRFGKDVVMIPDDDKHFVVTTQIAISDQFYGWVCGFGGKIEVVAPPEVRQGLREMTARLAEQHQ